MRRKLLFLTLALIIGASMSLFDTDKHSEDRSSPVPNHSDALIGGATKAHGTFSTNYVSDAVSVDDSLHGGFFRVIAVGTVTMPARSTAGTDVVVVDLSGYSFTPAFTAYLTNGSSLSVPIPRTSLCGAGGANDGKVSELIFGYILGGLRFEHTVTAAGVTDGNYQAAAFPIKYYLLQQTAN